MEISGVFYGDAHQIYELNYVPDIVFAQRPSGALTLQLLLPVPRGERERQGYRFPLVVDVPGSGWSGADGHRHVPAMTHIAEQGYAVACISYRGTYRDDVRFPAAVQDLMEAVRFLRAHADEYGIDAGRVALLGDSSGGHTVAMGALCGSEERMNIGEHLDMDRTVSACVIFYGPNDFEHLVDDRLAEGKKLRPGEGEVPFEAHEMFLDDYKRDPAGMLRDASATAHIVPGRAMPPFMFIQGDEDAIIPVRQGVRFCARVRECGGRAEFFKVAGAQHGRGCWTPQVYAQIVHFLNTYV